MQLASSCPGVIEALSTVDPIHSVLQAAFDAGKQLIGESPAVRGKGSIFAFKEAIYEKHVNVFTYPPLAALHAHMGSVSIYSDQEPGRCCDTKDNRMDGYAWTAAIC